MKNADVIITRHACDRYLEIFGDSYDVFDADERYMLVREKLRKMFADAVYVSDDENGVLFRNGDLFFVVKRRKIITVFKKQKEG